MRSPLPEHTRDTGKVEMLNVCRESRNELRRKYSLHHDVDGGRRYPLFINYDIDVFEWQYDMCVLRDFLSPRPRFVTCSCVSYLLNLANKGLALHVMKHTSLLYDVSSSPFNTLLSNSTSDPALASTSGVWDFLLVTI